MMFREIRYLYIVEVLLIKEKKLVINTYNIIIKRKFETFTQDF